MSNTTALDYYLQVFQPYLASAGVTELCINRPYELWLEQQGQFQCVAMPQLSRDFLYQFAGLVAEYNHREISPEYPTLSAVLPDGCRIQLVIEPACEKGSFICAIRRKSVQRVPLQQYLHANHRPAQDRPTAEETLLSLYQQGASCEFLQSAVRFKKNIVIAGGTSTGKTTLLNSLLEYIPSSERLITLETDREVVSTHPNRVHLLAAEEGRSLSQVTMLDLLKSSLRLRPDRILVSELRAEEAFPYLRAINSGHPGSLTTMHAENPQGCFDQLAFMALQSGCHLSRQELVHYAKSIIHVIVQVRRHGNGARMISEIYFSG